MAVKARKMNTKEMAKEMRKATVTAKAKETVMAKAKEMRKVMAMVTVTVKVR